MPNLRICDTRKKKILARTLRVSLRPFVHWLLSTASPVCQQRETGRFLVQDLGSGHVERTLRTRRMRSSPYVAGRHAIENSLLTRVDVR